MVRAPCSPCRGLELEIVLNRAGTRFYANALTRCIRPYQNDPELALVSLKVDGSEVRCLADRLEGGQRVYLGEELGEHLRAALCNGKTVTLEVGSHKEEIEPCDFVRHWNDLHCTAVCIDN
ncbi:MAG: hypothetical protein KDK78_01845 [Chlamydiia bacterium]|nr:hypothetical protein [Chlamydiia bacterium]